MSKAAEGFSLVELLAVLVIVGVLAVSAGSRFLATGSMQLQAGRDTIVAALFAAQQRAMAQSSPVRAVVGANQVDVQQFNGATWNSILVGATQYPVVLSPGQTITPTPSFTYDRLGRTSGTTLTLQQGTGSATIVVSDSGYTQ